MADIYTKPSLSGYNSSPPPDDGTKVPANEIRWSNHKSKLADPLKSHIDAISNETNDAFNRLVEPPNATDSGTDAYTGDSGRTLSAGEIYIWDFSSANTTTTPTLNDDSQGAKTITDRDGNALWSGAINGVHELQYASGTDTYLLLEPRPTAAKVNHAPMARDSAGRTKVTAPTSADEAANRDFAWAGAWGKGFIVAVSAASNVKVVDPRDFATDNAAIQDANDFLVAEAIPGGTIWLPLARPDGSRLTVESTVTIGSETKRTAISVRQPGYGLNSGHILTTINNATPVFKVTGELSNNLPMSHTQYELMIDCQDNDANGIEFQDCNSFRAELVVRKTHGDAIQVTGACSGFWIRARVQLADEQATPTANMAVFTSNTNGRPTNFHLDLIGDGPGLRGILLSDNADIIGAHIRAHIERVHNDRIKVGQGNGATILPGTRLSGLSAESGHNIRFDGNGGSLIVCDGVECNTSPGAGIRVFNNTNIGEHIYVSPNVIFKNQSADDINIDDAAPTGFMVLPQTTPGTRTYPSASTARTFLNSMAAI